MPLLPSSSAAAIAALCCLCIGSAHALTYTGERVLLVEPTCDGSDPLCSLTAPGTSLSSGITPDGNAVLFRIGGSPTLPDGTYRMDLPSRAVSPLPPTTPFPDTHRTTSADGRFHVTVTTSMPTSVIVHDQLTGIDTPIPRPDDFTVFDHEPLISADGSTVAFSRNLPVNSLAMVYDRVHGVLAALAPDLGGVAISLSLSDDGRRLAFSHRPRFAFADDPLGLWVYTREDAAPIALAHDLTVATDPGQCSADIQPAQVDAGSSDPDGDAVTLSLSPAGPYPVGRTTVTLTVSDGRLSSTAAAVITVVDAEPPRIAARVRLPILLFPTGRLVDIGLRVDATDNCAVDRIAVAVTQDEPVHADDPRPDAVVRTIAGEPTVRLRAERSPAGDGRVYLIQTTAIDIHGNRASAFSAVVVPRRLTLPSILSAVIQGLVAQLAATPLPYDSESFGHLSSAG
jgi:hypothetical protein